MAHYDPAVHPPLLCIGCNKTPAQLGYETYRLDEDGEPMTRPDGTLYYNDDDDYIWNEEGTLNRQNGHFLCDMCYINAGQPSGPSGWIAP